MTDRFGNAGLHEFHRIAGHDLRSPIRGIRTLTQFVREDGADRLPPEVVDHLDRIDERTDRMSTLIDGVLEFSRAGLISEVTERLQLRDLVEGTVATMAIDGRVMVGGEAADRPVEVHAEPLRSCVRALIDNAFRHHPESTPDVRVRIGTTDSAMIRIAVADDGAGIEERFVDRIFEPFFRIDATDGAGMGLAVARKAAHLHGGTVAVESEPGRGSTFTLRWPAVPIPTA